MKKWHLLGQDTTPDGSILSLHEREGDYVIRANGRELMSTRHVHSEEKLAELACAPFREKSNAKVLIGGLGLGFTLRSALSILAPSAKVIVVELMPVVLEWNRNPAYNLANVEVNDPRTNIVIGDVGTIIAQSSSEFDAIMLDADNGTTAMNSTGNQRLYQDTGLMQVHGALKGRGVVAYWSAQDDPIFAKRMSRSGFKVDTHKVRSHISSGSIHTLLVGRRLELRY